MTVELGKSNHLENTNNLKENPYTYQNVVPTPFCHYVGTLSICQVGKKSSRSGKPFNTEMLLWLILVFTPLDLEEQLFDGWLPSVT